MLNLTLLLFFSSIVFRICSYLCKGSIMSGGYPPLCPFPSMFVWPFFSHFQCFQSRTPLNTPSFSNELPRSKDNQILMPAFSSGGRWEEEQEPLRPSATLSLQGSDFLHFLRRQASGGEDMRAVAQQRKAAGWLSGEGGGLRGRQRGAELKGTKWESLLHEAQQQGQESPCSHCWLSPLQPHTHITHTHSWMHWAPGNAISHSVDVEINLAAESL